MQVGGDVEPAQARLARDWSELPLDTLTSVFTKLGPIEILMGAGLVCHPWLTAAKEPSLWRYLDMTSHNNVVKEKMRSGAIDVSCAMAKEAVARSSGQLEVFMGEEFVDDDLLKYIGGRAPSLKILHLTSCLTVNEAFLEAINKFPLLDDLKLSACENIGGRATYEAVGNACRNLTRLEVGKCIPSPWGYVIDRSDNSDCDEARGIATMHELRYLKLYYNKLNNQALAAILDNCPHLESLHLQCGQEIPRQAGVGFAGLGATWRGGSKRPTVRRGQMRRPVTRQGRDPAAGGSLAPRLAQYSRHGSSISDPHALISKVIHLQRKMEAGGDAELVQARLARDWSELPLDTLTLVFAKLGPIEILMGAGLVCHPWLTAAKDPSLWWYLDMTSHNNLVEDKIRSGARDVLCAMAKEAVDRSSGQLEVFMGEEFVDDDLLKYIGGRAPLNILHLTSCPTVHNEAFVEAINKFPLLEELKLSACENVGGRATYEAVGNACPNLEHLEVRKRAPSRWQSIIDRSIDSDCGEARGIATMHELRYLKLYYSKLNNEALFAILDNCPHMEYLHLQYCVNILLNGPMRAKCAGIEVVGLTWYARPCRRL